LQSFWVPPVNNRTLVYITSTLKPSWAERLAPDERARYGRAISTRWLASARGAAQRPNRTPAALHGQERRERRCLPQMPERGGAARAAADASAHGLGSATPARRRSDGHPAGRNMAATGEIQSSLTADRLPRDRRLGRSRRRAPRTFDSRSRNEKQALRARAQGTPMTADAFGEFERGGWASLRGVLSD
jgi:hypothetical protein